MYIVLSFLAAVTSGVAVIFQKKGTYGKNMIQISAVHLLALFVTALCVTLLKGGAVQLVSVPSRSWFLAAVSGLVQAGSWVAYFFAMEKANVSFLMVLDKTGIIVTILLAAVFLDERITLVMLLGSMLILAGTALMGDLKGAGRLLGSGNRWILWGIVSPALQAVSNILGGAGYSTGGYGSDHHYTDACGHRLPLRSGSHKGRLVPPAWSAGPQTDLHAGGRRCDPGRLVSAHV